MGGLLGGVSAKAKLEEALPASPVKPMEDGAMGSIRWIQSEPRSLGMVLLEAPVRDADRVLVSMAVSRDHHGDLFESISGE
jgi:hypothetical protein